MYRRRNYVSPFPKLRAHTDSDHLLLLYIVPHFIMYNPRKAGNFMIKHSDSIEIAAPVSDVFAFVSNVENLPKFQSDVVKSTPLSNEPMRAGTRFEEVVNILGRKVATVCEVTDYQPTRRFGFRSVSSQSIRYAGTMDLQPNGRGTRVTLNVEISLNGWLRLVEPMFKLEVKKGVRNEVEALKKLMEQ